MIKIFKHIIWDWNGTLFNDVNLCLDVLNGLLHRNHLKTIDLETYKEIFTFPVRDYYAKAGFDLNKLSFEILGSDWMNEYQNRRLEAHLFPSAINVLEKINENRIEQSILSAYMQDTLIELVNHFNLRHYFTHLTGLDNIYAASKVELGKKLIEKLDHKRDEVLLIGDTVHDFEVAKEIGTDCVLIASGHQSKLKLLECGAPVYENLDDMIGNSSISVQGLAVEIQERF